VAGTLQGRRRGAALENQGSLSQRSPRRLAVELVATMAALRRMRMSSPAIAVAISLPLPLATDGLRRLVLNKVVSVGARFTGVRAEHGRLC
jgi:hypothetical protein